MNSLKKAHGWASLVSIMSILDRTAIIGVDYIHAEQIITAVSFYPAWNIFDPAGIREQFGREDCPSYAASGLYVLRAPVPGAILALVVVVDILDGLVLNRYPPAATAHWEPE